MVKKKMRGETEFLEKITLELLYIRTSPQFGTGFADCASLWKSPVIAITQRHKDLYLVRVGSPARDLLHLPLYSKIDLWDEMFAFSALHWSGIELYSTRDAMA
jgi:hypothetical protein